MTLCTCCMSRKSPRRKLGGGFGRLSTFTTLRFSGTANRDISRPTLRAALRSWVCCSRQAQLEHRSRGWRARSYRGQCIAGREARILAAGGSSRGIPLTRTPCLGAEQGLLVLDVGPRGWRSSPAIPGVNAPRQDSLGRVTDARMECYTSTINDRALEHGNIRFERAALAKACIPT